MNKVNVMSDYLVKPQILLLQTERHWADLNRQQQPVVEAGD